MNYTKAPAVVSIDANAQRGWITVGHFKKELARIQELAALKLQEIINAPGTTITELEASLANYRKVHNEMVSEGQQFRKFITEKVLQPSLDIEKQYAPKTSDAYLAVEKQLTDKKLEQETANKATQAKAQEKLNYEAHIKNEYVRVANELRIAGLKEINTMYVTYLKGKVKKPDTDAIKETVKAMQQGKYNVYPCQYLSVDEKKAIIASIVAPDYDKIREDLVSEVDNKFASYQHDLKANNVEEVEVVAAEEIAEIAKETDIERGVNQMQASASIPVVMTEGKALKRTVEVVIEGGEQWMINVLTAFLKNPLCRGHINVKAWENLTVKQIAAALGKFASETGEQDSGLQYREVVK